MFVVLVNPLLLQTINSEKTSLPEDKITERNEGKVEDGNFKKEKNANQK